MGKTTLGYTEAKLEEKAAKRGISVRDYIWYLGDKQRAMRGQKKRLRKILNTEEKTNA